MFLSTAHTEGDVDAIIAAANASLAECKNESP
jgi:glutamate-1-semialdehyde aminotransferase